MKTNNLIVISDTHIGCQLGLCPPEGIVFDEGGMYMPNPIQLAVWEYWRHFWDVWVPSVTRGEKYAVVLNGDAMDGRHHGSTHQISQNLSDQVRAAKIVLGPIVKKAKLGYYHVRGTEAHSGQSGENEETLARELGAIPNGSGQYARYDLWKEVGSGLVHLLHHIGTSSSNAYEGTAVNKEITEEFNESARWGERAPDVIIRSHRHRHIKITIPTARGEGIAEVTPGWQAKTPFTWKIAGGRLAPPQFGGIIVKQGDEELYTRSRVWTIGRSKTE
jgi:hypothetical protein